MSPARAAQLTAAAPKRLAFMYIPNGVIGNQWFPEEAGKNFDDYNEYMKDSKTALDSELANKDMQLRPGMSARIWLNRLEKMTN